MCQQAQQKIEEKMEQRVVITGIGAITPVGNHIEETWNNLVEGKCGINYLKGYDEYNLPIKVAGQIKNFDQSEYDLNAGLARRSDKFCVYAMAAAADAMKDSGLKSGENIDPERLGVYIGSGIGGMETFVNQTQVLLEEGAHRISPFFVPMMISNIASGNVAISHNAQGVCLPVVTACATSTNAAGEAYRAIKHGYADAIITGGAEASVHPLAIAGFANSKALITKLFSSEETSVKSIIEFNFSLTFRTFHKHGQSHSRTIWRYHDILTRLCLPVHFLEE